MDTAYIPVTGRVGTRKMTADTTEPAPAPPAWQLPTETDLPHTGLLCTTVAMLASTDPALSAGYTSAVDLIPLVRPATGEA